MTESPKFSTFETRLDVRPDDIDSSIQMLQQYLEVECIEPLLDALQALKEEPGSESRRGQLVAAFNSLGPQQGAVLTYAPYVGILLSDDSLGG